VTIRSGELYFDTQGGFDFRFKSDNVVLADELKFITDALANLIPGDTGALITPLLPAGVSAELILPLPDIGTGAFTLTGITLYTHFDLLITNGFELRTGLWLSRPDRPFGLAVLFLGGGGWVSADVTYRPPSDFKTRVSIGISAGAFIAVDFVVARASAGLLFTAGVDFYHDFSSGNGDTTVSLGILVWGEFSVMGIASAYVRLTLRLVYSQSGGGMTGYGQLSLSIKICWCFTLHVDYPVVKPFNGGGLRVQQRTVLLAEAALAPQLLASPAPPIDAAVDLYLQALDLEWV
jgi:hypothetical protein